jgi:SAM-dependent methyltransferase
MSPLCQTHIEESQLHEAESFYPLRVFICERCFLVQLPEYVAPTEIFSEYAYFSSYIDTLVRQAQEYVDMMTERFRLGSHSRVLEVASNDGYLLQHFVGKGIPVVGVEPAANVAAAAEERGVSTLVRFFGVDTARQLVDDGLQADVVLGNNVLAHVPDLHDFVGGATIAVKRGGVVTMDFQHLMRMMERNQFDTIYQEHYSYLSFTFVQRLFARHELTIFDVEELPTHGGSIRIFARHADASEPGVTERVARMLATEDAAGLNRLDHYADYGERVKSTKRDLLECLIAAKRQGKSIVGYGAAGKTNTLLNYCGIGTDFIDYTVDRNPYKQGKYLPGTHIPIRDPAAIADTKPDYLFVGPWNLVDEITAQTSYIRDWGGRWIVPIPSVQIVE